MCGDFGFSYELFQCKACQFRSQHSLHILEYASTCFLKTSSFSTIIGEDTADTSRTDTSPAIPLLKPCKPPLRNPAANGYTALHVAARLRHLHIVKELVLLLTQEDLEIRDDNGSTALHLAVLNGHLHIVKELVPLMRKEALEINDGHGYTALGRAIELCHKRGDEYSEGDVIEIIKPMVAKNQRILSIVASPNDYIPVVEACMMLKFKVCRYIFSITPREALMPPENRSQGASIIVFCLGAKEFAIPLDLLSNCPRLATVETVHGGNSPILVLCRMHSAFLSGM